MGLEFVAALPQGFFASISGSDRRESMACWAAMSRCRSSRIGLSGASAASWREAAEKARYIIRLYAATLGAADTQRRSLVDAALADFERLEKEDQAR